MTRRWFSRRQSLPETTLLETTLPEAIVDKLTVNSLYGKTLPKASVIALVREWANEIDSNAEWSGDPNVQVAQRMDRWATRVEHLIDWREPPLTFDSGTIFPVVRPDK